SPTVPVTIPDPGTATSTLDVTESLTLTDVNVRVQATHTRVGDLAIELRSPAGTVVQLLNRPVNGTGSCRDNDMDVTFDDASAVSLVALCAGTTPWYSGTAAPLQTLSSFNGQDTAGRWTLTVRDLS